MTEVIKKRVISFGKKAIYNKRKENEIELELELRNTTKGVEFSCCCNVWNRLHTDIIMGGQCLDTLKEYCIIGHNKRFKTIHRLWKLYHLNSMHAGTIEQDAAIEAAKADGTWEFHKDLLEAHKSHVSHYEIACSVLKEKGLFEVTLEDGTSYKYGHSWLYRPIPEEDLALINDIIDGKVILLK